MFLNSNECSFIKKIFILLFREVWGWDNEYDLARLTEYMIQNLGGSTATESKKASL